MSECTCKQHGIHKIYDFDCPTCGIDSPERGFWCTCGDPHMKCPIHDAVCPDCGEEMDVHEVIRKGKHDACDLCYGDEYEA